MADMTVREKLDWLDIDEPVIIFDNPSYDRAFIGLTFDNIAVCDYDLMVEHLMDEDGMSESEAQEFIDYNIVGFHYDKREPIVVHRLESYI